MTINQASTPEACPSSPAILDLYDVPALVVESEIQSFVFFILCNTQTHNSIEDLQDDGADHTRVHDCGEHT